MSIADRIAVMNVGVLEQMDTPEEIYARPATLFVATFIGTMNRLDAIYDPPSASLRAGPFVMRVASDIRPAAGQELVRHSAWDLRWSRNRGCHGISQSDIDPATTVASGQRRRHVVARSHPRTARRRVTACAASDTRADLHGRRLAGVSGALEQVLSAAR